MIMKRICTTLAAIGLTTALAACGQKPAEPPLPSDTPMSAASIAPVVSAAPSSDMAGMDMAPAAKTAKGTGVVTAVDKTAGTITLDHGPIPKAGWPAMTMAFKASPASLLDQVKVGDHVAFDLRLKDGSGEVTAVSKR
jgi:Cu(I)/Ag(I) efflux system protein CusF